MINVNGEKEGQNFECMQEQRSLTLHRVDMYNFLKSLYLTSA